MNTTYRAVPSLRLVAALLTVTCGVFIAPTEASAWSHSCYLGAKPAGGPGSLNPTLQHSLVWVAMDTLFLYAATQRTTAYWQGVTQVGQPHTYISYPYWTFSDGGNITYLTYVSPAGYWQIRGYAHTLYLCTFCGPEVDSWEVESNCEAWGGLSGPGGPLGWGGA
jgi:hypothetical protein